MKKKYFMVPAFAFLALFGAGSALANGGSNQVWKLDPVKAVSDWTNRMSSDAGVLGISIDDMKNYWANGKNVAEIAKEKGISNADLQAKMKAIRIAEVKAQLQVLVEKGVITQAQADARLRFTQDNVGKKFNHMGRGRHGHGMMIENK
ncbi:MAG: hypothetical protein Q7S24_02085 [bacterium]|nr:hypothetical protein [bacterium]